jgi:hypothetical protein
MGKWIVVLGGAYFFCQALPRSSTISSDSMYLYTCIEFETYWHTVDTSDLHTTYLLRQVIRLSQYAAGAMELKQCETGQGPRSLSESHVLMENPA